MNDLSIYNIQKEFVNTLKAIEEMELDKIEAENDVEAMLKFNNLYDNFMNLQGQANDKIIAFGYFIKALDNKIEIVENEKKRINELDKRLKTLSDNRKQFLKMFMNTTGIKKVESNTLTVSLRKNRESVQVIDEKALNGKYKTVVQETKIDKNAIYNDHKAGQEITGVVFNQSESLSIK